MQEQFPFFHYNTSQNLAGEYNQIEPDYREGVRAQLERMKKLCKKRNNLYEKQNDLKEQKQKVEKSLERHKMCGAAISMPYIIVVNEETGCYENFARTKKQKKYWRKMIFPLCQLW